MNYLAHCVLSFGDEQLLAGQFLADDVKGRSWELYPEPIRKGILLHRFIDDYTDRHELLLDLKQVMRPEMGKFAGVALDVLFDHVLSLRWHNHVEKPKSDAIREYYHTLEKYNQHFSERRKVILARMIQYDWMNMYDSAAGTFTILRQLGLRIPVANPLHEVSHCFKKHEKEIISAFDLFFPDLLSATQDKLDTFAP